MKIKKPIMICILLLMVCIERASSETFLETMFKKASEDYTEGHFKEALTGFSKITQAGQESGELYYNMGNCYFKLNMIGEAVLFYEKALQLLKRDPDVKYNLNLARSVMRDQGVDTPESIFVKFFAVLGGFMNLWELTILTVTWGWVILTMIIFRKVILFFWEFLMILIFIALFTQVSWYSLYKSERIDLSAIVTLKEAKVRSGPGKSFPVNYKIHEGTKILIIDQDTGGAKIRLMNGETGWISQRGYKVINKKSS